jgi:hypothetical protein
MKYRYRGSGFVIDLKPHEIPSETIARLRDEQRSTDKPMPALMASQVRLVHAIEDVANAVDFEQCQRALVVALREFARQTHHLDPTE